MWLIIALIDVFLGLINVPWAADGSIINAVAAGWCFGMAFMSFLNWLTSPF